MAYLKGSTYIDGDLYIDGSLRVRTLISNSGRVIPYLEDSNASIVNRVLKFSTTDGEVVSSNLEEIIGNNETTFSIKNSRTVTLNTTAATTLNIFPDSNSSDRTLQMNTPVYNISAEESTVVPLFRSTSAPAAGSKYITKNEGGVTVYYVQNTSSTANPDIFWYTDLLLTR